MGAITRSIDPDILDTWIDGFLEKRYFSSNFDIRRWTKYTEACQEIEFGEGLVLQNFNLAGYQGLKWLFRIFVLSILEKIRGLKLYKL